LSGGRYFFTQSLLQRNRPVRTVDIQRLRARGVLMPERERETDQQRMLLLVESAQRAGLSEREIVEIVEDAIKADAEHERAA
jgi:hypothetical protein